MKKDFDLSSKIRGIRATTLIVAGDADIFPPAHAVEMFGLLGADSEMVGGTVRAARSRGSGLTHYTIFSDPALAATVIPFLDERAPTDK